MTHNQRDNSFPTPRDNNSVRNVETHVRATSSATRDTWQPTRDVGRGGNASRSDLPHTASNQMALHQNNSIYSRYRSSDLVSVAMQDSSRTEEEGRVPFQPNAINCDDGIDNHDSAIRRMEERLVRENGMLQSQILHYTKERNKDLDLYEQRKARNARLEEELRAEREQNVVLQRRLEQIEEELEPYRRRWNGQS